MILDTKNIAEKVVNFILKNYYIIFVPSLVGLFLVVDFIHISKDIKIILTFIIALPFVFFISLTLTVINANLWGGTISIMLKIENSLIISNIISIFLFFLVIPIWWALDNNFYVMPILVFYSLPSIFFIFMLWHSEF